LAGYSDNPLVKKLGIKTNFRIKLINPPANYFELLSGMPEGIELLSDSKSKKDFIHYFLTQIEELNNNIHSLRDQLQPNGMLWISWHKKSSKIPTNVTEDKIRELALKNGLVDIKVCAIDEKWSALKLVIPVKDRN
jgi:hypothetical protein